MFFISRLKRLGMRREARRVEELAMQVEYLQRELNEATRAASDARYDWHVASRHNKILEDAVRSIAATPITASSNGSLKKLVRVAVEALNELNQDHDAQNREGASQSDDSTAQHTETA